MKDFNDLYKSYLKNIIKEDPDEGMPNDVSSEDMVNQETSENLSIDDLKQKYIGKTVIFKKLVWKKNFEDEDEDEDETKPVKFEIFKTKIKDIKEVRGEDDEYVVKFTNRGNIDVYYEHSWPLETIAGTFEGWKHPEGTLEIDAHNVRLCYSKSKY